MISKSIIRLITSLRLKKERKRTGLFVAEGPKVVGDMLCRYSPRLIIATGEWLSLHADTRGADIIAATDDELRRASLLQHPQQVMALMAIPDNTYCDGDAPLPASTLDTMANGLSIALDGVQDPGNLGTIIRIADWFGICHIACSPDTADAYNPKVVQAAMGSLGRVTLSYSPLPPLLSRLSSSLPVYGTTLDGDNIYSARLPSRAVVVMGNEGNGISQSVMPCLSRRLLIPRFDANRHDMGHAESLNVAIATAIVCAEFRRNSSQGLNGDK